MKGWVSDMECLRVEGGIGRVVANICSFSPLIGTLHSIELKSVDGQEAKWPGLGSSPH